MTEIKQLKILIRLLSCVVWCLYMTYQFTQVSLSDLGLHCLLKSLCVNT